MSSYVVDASIAVEYLLRTPVGLSVGELLAGDSLLAPQIMDVEVMSVLRRAVLRGDLQEPRARLALQRLASWPLRRISHRDLIPLAWEHYRNVTAMDAFYVAAARVYGVPVLTADGRLARAPGLGVAVQYVRMG